MTPKDIELAQKLADAAGEAIRPFFRKKFEQELAPKVGEDRAAEIADQVIPKMKERGVVIDDPIAEAVDEMVDGIRTSTSGADGS